MNYKRENRDTNDFRSVAEQLANPTGPEGVLVAQRMNASNGAMTKKAIDLLDCRDGQDVLEIGPGNAQFAAYVIGKASNVRYEGTDISTTMIDEGKRINQPLLERGHRIGFHLTDGWTLPYAASTFDRVFSVNTIYFWKDPARMLREIARVLRTGGICCLSFASRAFMESLPFTDERFTLYTVEEVEALFRAHGFTIRETFCRHHETVSAGKAILMREEIFITATPTEPCTTS